MRRLWSVFGFLLAGTLPSGSAATAQTPCQAGVPRALVLSGGGSKGAFEAGAMYHVIVHRGCDFVDIAGVSVGGLNASYVGAAPMGTDSLANLQDRTRNLVNLWRDVPGPQQFLTKRFLGPVRMAIFGIESLYDFGPARKWIAKNIDPSEISQSGRNVRIGTVNFYDGTYHEITPGTTSPSRPMSVELQGNLARYRDFVLGGALIPVFGEMPRIPDDQNPDSEYWPQYADGGLRHQTPISRYFDLCDIKVFAVSGAAAPLPRERATITPDGASPAFARRNCLSPVPLHEKVHELMIVMSSPYDQTSDRIPPPYPADPKRKHVADGRKILERTVMDIVLDSPYRWDAGFAIVANRAIAWRAKLYDSAKQTLPPDKFDEFKKEFTELNDSFPVESSNIGPEGFSLPYKLGIVRPARALTDTYEFDHTRILEQLNAGCVAANEMMKADFHAPEMKIRCDKDLPWPK